MEEEISQSGIRYGRERVAEGEILWKMSELIANQENMHASVGVGLSVKFLLYGRSTLLLLVLRTSRSFGFELTSQYIARRASSRHEYNDALLRICFSLLI